MANEKRLIYKDELIKLCDAPHWCVWMSEIEDFPTVDAVEVAHGRWIYEYDTVMKWTMKAICSACKCVVEQNVELAHDYGRENHTKRNKYCPNCGAKMDGDGNEP